MAMRPAGFSRSSHRRRRALASRCAQALVRSGPGSVKVRHESRGAFTAPGPPATCEHMPPMGMFRDRQRPGAMGYRACGACNKGTRGSGAVAALIARMHPDPATYSAFETRRAKTKATAPLSPAGRGRNRAERRSRAFKRAGTRAKNNDGDTK
jgi:hypothetical protein